VFPASVFSARAREAAGLKRLRHGKGITKNGPIKDPTDPDKLIKAPAISEKNSLLVSAFLMAGFSIAIAWFNKTQKT